MRKLRILFLAVKSYLLRYQKVIIVVGVLYIVLVIFLTRFNNIKLDLFHDSISEGLVGTYTENDLPVAVTSLMSESLVNINKEGESMANLANSWENNAEINEFIFKIKDNLFWSDGTKVNAWDLNISIPDVEISVVDEYTIKFKLADSYSPLPSLLTKPILKKGNGLGIGPYFIYEIEKDQVFIKKIELRSADPNLPFVVIRFYPNEKIAREALEIGEVQSILSVNDLSGLEYQAPFGVISKTNYSRVVAIFYNTKDAILSDRNFRLALGYGAPVIENQKEAKTSISPYSFSFNDDVKDFLNDSVRAKEYLEKVKNKGEEPISLTVTSSLKEIGDKVVKSWNDQGIESVLRVESGIPQNFQALLIAQNIPLDPDQYSLWHSTQKQTNISQYGSGDQFSPRVDKDLEDGRKTVDQEERKLKYMDFQKHLLDDAPATFLYFPKYNVLYLKKKEESLKKVLDYQFSGLHLFE